MTDHERIYAAAQRAIRPLATYSAHSGLEDSPQSIADASAIATNMIVDVLHCMTQIQPTEILPMGSKEIEIVHPVARGLKVLTDAIDTFVAEQKLDRLRDGWPPITID